jgi:hypothetical protein
VRQLRLGAEQQDDEEEEEQQQQQQQQGDAKQGEAEGDKPADAAAAGSKNMEAFWTALSMAHAELNQLINLIDMAKGGQFVRLVRGSKMVPNPAAAAPAAGATVSKVFHFDSMLAELKHARRMCRYDVD